METISQQDQVIKEQRSWLYSVICSSVLHLIQILLKVFGFGGLSKRDLNIMTKTTVLSLVVYIIMPKNVKEPFLNGISLVTAKISQFETTLRIGLSTLTASQNDMHHKIEDNDKKSTLWKDSCFKKSALYVVLYRYSKWSQQLFDESLKYPDWPAL
ncbi:hypothetical protein G6F56_009023 [Rhizopus delemar]|nr:hypothetical protein G6F56_009023 [Rhizopus delemar]